MRSTRDRGRLLALASMAALASCQPTEARDVRSLPPLEDAPSTQSDDEVPDGGTAVPRGAPGWIDDAGGDSGPDGAASNEGAGQAETAGAAPTRTLVVPGPEGLLGTWRVFEASGRQLPAEAESTLGQFCEEQPEGCTRGPRIQVSDTETLDLDRVGPGRPATVYLGGRLWTPRATVVHLLVGCRGELSVQLDGREVLHHASHRLRADDATARLELTPGDHSLVLRFTRPDRGAWRATVRVLDERLRPGTRPAQLAVGLLDEAAAGEHAARAVRISEVNRLDETGPTAHIKAALPAGGIASSVTVDLIGEHTLEPCEGTFTASVEHHVPFPERGRLDLNATAGTRRIRLGQHVVEDRPALEAQAALEAVLEKAPPASRAPLAWRAAELARVVREHDPDRAWRTNLVREATRMARAVTGGQDPFGAPRGYQRMAFISGIDDTPQPYELFVPPGYRYEDTRLWPLVVTLHGFKGNAGDYFRNTFGLARDHEGGETLLGHGRHGEPPRRGPMFVIAPTGRGQAMYRYAGETDVLEALADVRRRFRIDPDRIYITGGSMGGTGAAYLPYRHPDLFAASAALAGYHDQRVRHDTDHDGLSPAEQFLRAERSDVDWAENGLHLHTLLVRGTRDQPIEWTRCLVRRLAALGYPHEHREPESGHNVWTETYAGGAIFRYFARFRRPSAPREVRLRTARERTRQAWWVRIDERAAPDAFADVHARIEESGRIVVTTEAVAALTLDPSEDLVPAGPLEVEVDGASVSGPRPLTLFRTESGWAPTADEHPGPSRKRAGASGPIRDVYHDPLVFVVGTQDPGHTVINRLVAEHWARPRGWIVDYPIVADTEVTEEMVRDHTLVLIGPPRSNLLTRRWQDRLPIRVEDDAIVVGSRRHSGVQAGAVFVAPHPESPDRSLLVIAGPRPLGTWRSIFLPDVLPDYVVFDEDIAPASDRWAAGGTGATYLEEGFFGMDWGIAGGPSPGSGSGTP